MLLQSKLALSSAGKMPDEALFRSYAENGIEGMEISVKETDYDRLDYAELERLAKQYGVHLWSFHFPFCPFEEIDISHPLLAAHTVALFKTYLQKASAIGIKVFVIHASGEPIEEGERSERMRCAKNSLYELAEYAAGLGCKIAVEDLPRSCLGRDSKEIAELTSVHDNLFVCFDTNHLLGEDPVDFVRRVGKKIITIHVSDYDRNDERHWLPGEGCVDWKALMAALDEVGYSGPWLYEIRFAAPWSIQRPRDLTCADFKNNYEELMHDKPLSKIGQPKPDLGMWK